VIVELIEANPAVLRPRLLPQWSKWFLRKGLDRTEGFRKV